ncbi:hypothetical protein ACFL9T_19785 [Thermodesulfobacteriota bacterium]
MPALLDLVLIIHHPKGEGAGATADAFVQNHDTQPTACPILGEELPGRVEEGDFWLLVQGKKRKGQGKIRHHDI